jgi:SEC-C motif-containing protein
MRSRYSAYAVGDTDYLLATWHPSTRPTRLALDPERRWTRLEVVDRSGGGLFDDTARVAFRAHSQRRGRAEVLAEDSRFVREGGRWLYVDG